VIARFRILLLALLSVPMVLSGCDAGYILHGAYEEIRLLWNRQPIQEVLQRPNLKPAARAKLELVLQVRKFAADQLGLNVGGAYSTVVAVDKSAITWVLMAAPPDELVPYVWHFPIVGAVPYKGFFARADAERAARELQARGYDTFVRSAVAFSSLGYFNDPLLSNLLSLNSVVLTGVIIHELFHRTYFVASDVMFDESAANFVGSAGAVAFYSAMCGPNSREAIQARDVLASDFIFARFLEREEARLLKLYGLHLPRPELLRRRAILFAEIKSDYIRLRPSLSGLERFDLDKEPLNNAVMINYRLYFHRLKYFAALYRMHDGDTRATVAAIIKLAKSEPGDPFNALWKATRNAPPAPAPAVGTPDEDATSINEPGCATNPRPQS